MGDARSWVIESLTFLRASSAETAHRFITTDEVWAICCETVLGEGSSHAIKVKWNDAGEHYWADNYVTQGESVAFDVMLAEPYRSRGMAKTKAWHLIWEALWSALYNRQLSSYVEHPATGEWRRVSSVYWVSKNREPGLVKLADCTGAAGFDLSMIGQPVLLDDQAVKDWAAKNLERVNLGSDPVVTKTGLPGRPTAKALVNVVFGERINAGALEPTLKAEAEAVYAIVGERLRPEDPKPTALTVENTIRAAYRAAKSH